MVLEGGCKVRSELLLKGNMFVFVMQARGCKEVGCRVRSYSVIESSVLLL